MTNGQYLLWWAALMAAMSGGMLFGTWLAVRWRR